MGSMVKSDCTYSMVNDHTYNVEVDFTSYAFQGLGLSGYVLWKSVIISDA